MHGRPRNRVSGIIGDGKDHNTGNLQRLLDRPGQSSDGTKNGNHRKHHRERKEIEGEELSG